MRAESSIFSYSKIIIRRRKRIKRKIKKIMLTTS